jgi:hypothetical protein
MPFLLRFLSGRNLKQNAYNAQQVCEAWWGLFSDTFSDIKAVESVLARLNTLRAPIAHCSMLGEDEVLRLRLSLRDWFRLME